MSLTSPSARVRARKLAVAAVAERAAFVREQARGEAERSEGEEVSARALGKVAADEDAKPVEAVRS